MDKIVCLVGESGSGKSTIAELLEKEEYNYIQSYTTRKPRFEGEKGHIFIGDANISYINEAISKNELISDVIAYTFFNGNHYWATKEQYQGKGISVYVIDPSGVKYLKEKVTDAETVVIYLKCDREVRLLRMLKERDPETVRDRLKNDKEVFKIIQCDYVVDSNRKVEEILEDVKSIIGGEIFSIE
ncbi:AAA family ATPase [Clostridium kluyveri]|uniref:Guanylate kinase n=1 Tax=Clostridium kluyveri TaxID=1534 RepID=A0A1L5FAS6_CLOKL|nr:AAA family ATPase [Clostridium kluyveri]APM40118.1 guanylate kinase [Clostridium kluyveri]UZQ49643.1 AAA family ATPase [Clostridium kluyveri]